MQGLNVSYHEESFLIVRFFKHFSLGVKPDIGDHERNIIEKVGDAGLWFVEELPRKVVRFCHDPKVVTIALTALALIAVTVGFYPITTYTTINAVILLLPVIPFWAAKFSVYIATVGLILSTSMRAMGRFVNSDLMNTFYGKETNENTQKMDVESIKTE